MSTANALRLARRELRGGLRGFRIFLACLALGVAAIAAVGSIRASSSGGSTAVRIRVPASWIANCSGLNRRNTQSISMSQAFSASTASGWAASPVWPTAQAPITGGAGRRMWYIFAPRRAPAAMKASA